MAPKAPAAKGDAQPQGGREGNSLISLLMLCGNSIQCAGTHVTVVLVLNNSVSPVLMRLPYFFTSSADALPPKDSLGFTLSKDKEVDLIQVCVTQRAQ